LVAPWLRRQGLHQRKKEQKEAVFLQGRLRGSGLISSGAAR
jgi:hypothetical protein